MKTKLLIAFLLVSLIVLSGCTQKKVVKVTCNKPYMLVGTSCCLDKNDNKICDNDEQIQDTEKQDDKITSKAVTQIPEKKTDPCGDDVCSSKEDCLNCELDCGKCITVKELKEDINKLYKNENYIWKAQEDKNNSNIKYYAFFKNRVVIAEITNKEDYMNNYDDFLNFNFNYNFSRMGEKTINESIFEDESLWHFINTSSLTLQTTMGKINEERGYWENKRDQAWVHHSFRVYCAPNIYIYFLPEWSTGFGVFGLGLNEDSLTNALKQFDVDSKKNIPFGVDMLSKCPLRNKTNDNLYALQKKINELLKKNYAYLFEDKEETERHISYDDGSKVVIDILKNNKLKNKKEFYDYVKIKPFLEDKEIIEEDANKFEEPLFKDYKRSTGINIDFYVYINNSYEDDNMFNDVFEIEEVDEDIVELIYGGVRDYKITYKKGESYKDANRYNNFRVFDESYPYFIYEIDLLCKPEIIVKIKEKNFNAPISLAYRSDYKKAMQRYVEEKRMELLPIAKQIYDYCKNNSI